MNVYVLTGCAVFAASVSRRRIDQRNRRRAHPARERVSRRRLAIQGQAQNLSGGLIQVLRGREALAIADRQKQILIIGRERDLRAFLSASASRELAPQDFEVIQSRTRGGEHELASRERQATAVVAGLCVREIDALVSGVARRNEHAVHAILPLPVDGGRVAQGADLLAFRRHEPHGAHLLGHEHAAVRQEGDAPRQRELARRRHRERQRGLGLVLAHVDLGPRAAGHCGRQMYEQSCRARQFHRRCPLLEALHGRRSLRGVARGTRTRSVM